mmetsp:Transcript_117172/g.343233  ORF Transcript_117172/g.343233 Transcript_117172/m.343233 type:complete len:296 (+) Transcript_117172:148-1035(+)
MLSGKSEKAPPDSKHRSKKGLKGKLRRARKAVEACDDKAWLASVSPPSSSEVASYLETFGYAAADSQTWEDLPQDEVPEGLARSGPWLGLGIAEHQEAGGHTWYQVECSLALQGSKTVEWQVGRRLQHLRELWYESVKRELGKSYKEHFEEVHFAHRGGRRGTSSRLNTWCSRLAARINAGQLSPAVVALTLRFIEAPDSSRQQELQSAPCATVGTLQVPPRRHVDVSRCCIAFAGEESVSSRSTHCSVSDGDHPLPLASSIFGGSDASESDSEGDEEYESDFETESESDSEYET